MDIPTLIVQLAHFFDKYGYLTVFLGSFVEVTPLGWLVPGGVILAVAGFFAKTENEINLVSVILFGSFGSWLSLLFSYFLGKKSGLWLVKKLKQEKNAELAKRLLKNHGGIILTTSMMANMTRFWISYIAGVEGYKFSKFILYSSVASLGWVSLMAILGYITGYERQNIEKLTASLGIIAWLLLGLALFVIYRSIKHEYHHFKKDLPHEEKI